MDNLFGIEKISVGDCQELTIQSLNAYAYQHDHWVIAWSGGKDSTATTTFIIYLILSGQIAAPKSLTVMYADTRQELTPLAISAENIINQIRALNLPWLKVKKVISEMDRRFLVYMLGRGVPPPNNMTLRWCTQQIKITPMEKAIEKEFESLGEKVLTITGVRMGESAIRDGRLSMACTKNGAECGQGWYMNELSDKITATIAPIIHWRVCNVWDWLQIFAPQKKYGGWDTQMLAEAYGGDNAKEINARTGCNGCPLVDEDTALDAVMQKYPAEWGYLKPMKGLRPIFREMRKMKYRLRKHGERKADGTLAKNAYRAGPLTIAARKKFTAQVIAIQNAVNNEARRLNRPEIDILNTEELERIRELQKSNTWPNKWDGTEPLATEPFNQEFADGSVSLSLYKMYQQ